MSSTNANATKSSSGGTTASSAATTANKNNSNNTHEEEEDEENRKRHKGGPVPGKKPSAEVLQRRKEGRAKAAITIAQNLKKTGIGRFEDVNKFDLTSVKSIPLINQKNYYTDYLKKDEQVSFVRNWRAKKLLEQTMKNMTKNPAVKDANADKKDGEVKNFDDFDLNDIEAEMNRKKDHGAPSAKVEAAQAEAAAAAAAADEEDDDEDEENEEEKMKQGYDTIVIHPGSSNIRMGRATDAYPKTIPTVIAVPNKWNLKPSTSKTPVRTIDDATGEVQFGDQFNESKSVVTKDFRSRMRYYKRRMLPNSREAAANFNKKQEPEIIPDHNDPFKKDLIDVGSIPSDRQFYVGEQALKLPLGQKFSEWVLRYPIINGKFNQSSEYYHSPHEVLGDLENIVTDSLVTMLELKRNQLSQYKAMLIIPDLYDKVYVETWVNLLFKAVGFGSVGIIQESVAATFGAGASTACVVDVGAQTTSIACVDEGMIINDSRIRLNYGGDHITETFVKLLLQQSFPYKDINLQSRVDDWELATTLKHNFVTFQDADIAVQLYNFYKRKPFEKTEKYEFKVFDEVMLAPMGVFYPDLYQIPRKLKRTKLLFPESLDSYTCKPNNPYSRSQESLSTSGNNYCDMLEDDLLRTLVNERLAAKSANPYQRPKSTRFSYAEDVVEDRKFQLHEEPTLTTPLEKAIIESITNAAIATDLTKLKKLYDNILIVGGGFSKISGYDLILGDRINIWRPKFLSSSAIDEVIEYVSGERLKKDAVKKELLQQERERRKQEIVAINQQRQIEHQQRQAQQPQQHQPGQEGILAQLISIPANIDDIELDEEIVRSIEEQTKLELDLEYIDSISDRGSVMGVNVLPPPREFDPEMLTWKGGSVYGRLKVVNEMWVTYADWNILETRCLYYKSLFNY